MPERIHENKQRNNSQDYSDEYFSSKFDGTSSILDNLSQIVWSLHIVKPNKDTASSRYDSRTDKTCVLEAFVKFDILTSWNFVDQIYIVLLVIVLWHQYNYYTDSPEYHKPQ